MIEYITYSLYILFGMLSICLSIHSFTSFKSTFEWAALLLWCSDNVRQDVDQSLTILQLPPEDGSERSGHAEDGVPPLRAPQPHRGPGGGRRWKDSGQQEIQFTVGCWKSVFGVNNILMSRSVNASCVWMLRRPNLVRDTLKLNITFDFFRLT